MRFSLAGVRAVHVRPQVGRVLVRADDGEGRDARGVQLRAARHAPPCAYHKLLLPSIVPINNPTAIVGVGQVLVCMKNLKNTSSSLFMLREFVFSSATHIYR